MSNTTNLQKYANLLVETLPVAIENEEERQKSLEVIDRLMKKGEANLSPEETKILGLMTVLAADYEKRTFTIQPLAPASRFAVAFGRQRLAAERPFADFQTRSGNFGNFKRKTSDQQKQSRRIRRIFSRFL